MSKCCQMLMRLCPATTDVHSSLCSAVAMLTICLTGDGLCGASYRTLRAGDARASKDVAWVPDDQASADG